VKKLKSMINQKKLARFSRDTYLMKYKKEIEFFKNNFMLSEKKDIKKEINKLIYKCHIFSNNNNNEHQLCNSYWEGYIKFHIKGTNYYDIVKLKLPGFDPSEQTKFELIECY
jgi:hypothetical protein